MPRYPRGARRPRKPWKGKPGLPSVVGNVSFTNMLGNPEIARTSYAQRNAYKNDKNPTKAEAKFRELLTGLKVRFQSQYTLSGKHILDFYLFDSKIAVEIDGRYHNTAAQKKKDKLKEAECKRNGIHLIRYTNTEVFEYPEDIREDLLEKTRGQKRALKAENSPPHTPTSSVSYNDFDKALSDLKQHGGTLRPSTNGGWIITR
jgi:very-short-patch-repair endonuclease